MLNGFNINPKTKPTFNINNINNTNNITTNCTKQQ